MRVLFVLNIPFALEPHGVMLLSAILKRAGHQVALALLKHGNLIAQVTAFMPDVVGYSVIGGEIDAFRRADKQLRGYMQTSGQRIFRMMGGPHPTFNPQVLDDLQLDAICQGDGERAFPALLERLEKGETLEGIPNIGLTGAGAVQREKLTSDELDALPFADRRLYYDAVPYVPRTGLRSFTTSRGCPYKCTHCYNNTYNRMFAGCGPTVRRRSVENILTEIAHVVEHFQPVRFIRFFDDNFCFQVDDWLREFTEKYPKRVGLPFYCLMRPNTFTEEMAQLLKKAGCYSMSMAIESGSEYARNTILKRGLSDAELKRAFDLTSRYGFNTYGNTMLGIPGTTLQDDFNSLEFTSNVKITVPSFTVCSPSRGTELADYAIAHGYMKEDGEFITRFGASSPLHVYTEREKRIQMRMASLGPMYCSVPAFLRPPIRMMMILPVPYVVTKYIGISFGIFRLATKIFPHAIPKKPWTIVRTAIDGIRYAL